MKKVVFLLVLGCLILSSLFWLTGETKAAGDLLINEVYYDTAGSDTDEEWVEVINYGGTKIDLTEYKIGDEETSGGSEGMYQWPAEAKIDVDQMLVVAKDAMGFYRLYGKFPDYEINAADDGLTDFSDTPDMIKYSSWSTGSFSLTNTGDEVLLVGAGDNVVDAVVFENGLYTGTLAHPGVDSGGSIERTDSNDTNNCAVDFVELANPTPGYEWVYRAGDYFFQTGQLEGEEEKYLSANQQSDPAGYLFYGPYASDQLPGLYQANFLLRTNNNTTSEVVARIDAHNSEGNGQWVYRDIKGTDFVMAGEWQNFSIFFARTDQGTMEYRVWFADSADLDFKEVMVGTTSNLVWAGQDLPHQNGLSVIDDGLSSQVWSSDQTGYMSYGPYANLPSGHFQAKMVISSDSIETANSVLRFDVINNNNYESFKEMSGGDFYQPNEYQAVKISFTNTAEDNNWEFRLFNYGLNEIRSQMLIVRQTEQLIYEAEDLISSGSLVSDSDSSGGYYVNGDPEELVAGWLVYGPYSHDLEPGNYQASFYLKIDRAGSDPVGKINTYDALDNNPEMTKDINGEDFIAVGKWQKFTQEFTLTQSAVMEYRVWFEDTQELGVDYMTIEKIN